MALEDFTTYTEQDEGDDITITSSKIAGVNLVSLAEKFYVYKNKGAAHFDGDFEHRFKIKFDNCGSAIGVWGWMVANAIGDWREIYIGDADALCLYVWSFATTRYIRIAESDGGTIDFDQYITTDADDGVIFYITIKKDEAASTYGTLYCYICKDNYYLETGYDLQGTLQVELHTSLKDYQYIYGIASSDNDSSTNTIDFDLWDLDLQEAPSAITKISSETVDIDEALLGKLEGWADIIQVPEMVVRSGKLTKVFSNVMSLVDTGLRRARSTRLVTETVNIAEQLLRIVPTGLVKIMTESVGLVDMFVKRARSIRLLSETIGIAETLLRRARSVRLKDDAVSIVEGVVRLFTSVRIKAEQVSIVETVLRTAGMVRVLSEIVNVVDAAIVRYQGLYTDVIHVLETHVRVMSIGELVKLMTETIGIADAAVRRFVSVRLKSEVVSVVETLSRRARSTRLLAEVVNIADAAVIRARAVRLLTETVSILETFVKWTSGAIVKIATEVIDIPEVVVVRAWMVRLMDESVSILETFVKWTSGKLVKIAAEVVGISEVAVRRMWAVRPVAEVVSIVDSAIKRAWSNRILAEVVNIVDVGLLRKRVTYLASETIGIIESALHIRASVRVIADVITIVDTAIRRTWLIGLMTEAISILDSFIRRSRMARIITEVVGILERFFRGKPTYNYRVFVKRYLYEVEVEALFKMAVQPLDFDTEVDGEAEFAVAVQPLDYKIRRYNKGV